MINKQKLSYKLYLNDIPISKNLKKLIDLKIIKKFLQFHQEMIIKYYLLPHLQNLESSLKLSKSLGIKISKIGKICNHNQKISNY